MRVVAGCVVAVLSLSNALYGQQAPGQLRFSVASVRRSPFNGTATVMTETDVAIRYSAVTLAAVVRRAYELDSFQLIGLSMLGSGTEVYEFAANLPERSTRAQIPAMLRQLLSDRFQLVVHREARPTDVYALVVDKGGLKLKPSRPPDADGPRSPPRPMTDPQTGRMHVEGSMTLGTLAAVLSGGFRRLANRPAIDATGVGGEFDIVLDAAYPVATAVSADDLGAPSIFAEIQKLGLKLEPRRAPVEYVVVDSVNKVPTEN